MWKHFKDTSLIPTKFTICGSTYNVEFYNHSKYMDGNLGDYCSIKHLIRIAKEHDMGGEDLTIPEDELLKTYLHELGHCFSYYYNNETSEEFANSFANFMYEYLHTNDSLLHHRKK